MHSSWPAGRAGWQHWGREGAPQPLMHMHGGKRASTHHGEVGQLLGLRLQGSRCLRSGVLQHILGLVGAGGNRPGHSNCGYEGGR